jgi:hypothetical protein
VAHHWGSSGTNGCSVGHYEALSIMIAGRQLWLLSAYSIAVLCALVLVALAHNLDFFEVTNF